MRYRAHAYQAYATQRIIEQPAVGLFIGLGLGKTVITLTAVSELLHDRFEVGRVLVIAPLRVAQDTWPREVSKWDHLKHLRLALVLGSEKQRRAALQQDADIWVINRENVSWLVQLLGPRWPFDMVVIDELSSFKAPNARRFRALRKVRPMIKRIVGLTGTPAPNGLIDLWPQVYLLDRGERLGKTVTGYRERYFTPGRRNRTVVFTWDPKPGAEKLIYGKLEDLCVSMSAEDWLELPEKIDVTVPIALPAAARRQYLQMERELLLPLGEDNAVTAITAAVLANKLLQMANGAVYDINGEAQELHTAKLEALAELLEAANGRSVLVYYAYKHDAARLATYLKAWHPRKLETSQDVEDWNAGRVQVMLAHPASAGHGLNLQDGGNTIVWFGLTWSLELYQQANARLHRQGQAEKVVVHHLVAEGTMDEEVMRVLAGKAAGQDALLEAVKARIERLKL
jgi:SNF2 family DNA or RNA helicase